MMTRKQPYVPALHVGRGSVVDALTVFPVWTDAPVVKGVDTGANAAVRVDERAGSPDLFLDDTPSRRDPKPLPGQRGVLVGVAGRPLLLELFGSSGALAAHLPSLLDGLRLDAAVAVPSGAAEVPGRLARSMASHVAGMPLDEVDDAGCGIALAGSGARSSIAGVALASGRLAHLTVLNTRHPLLEPTWN